MSNAFLRGEWAWIVVAAPAAWLVLRLLDRRRAARAASLFGPRAAKLAPEPTPGRTRVRRALFAAALLCALLAVLQPVWGDSVRKLEQRGVDVVVCLDVSRSMLARDVAPDRLRAARREVAALVDHARGDRFALIAFAGDARLVVPLTSDAESFTALLGGADPLTIARGVTDLGAALDVALAALGGATGDHETILLLTDGADEEGRGLRAAERCRDRNVTVHCAGFGTARGSKIAIAGEGGETFLRDRSGREVVSALEPASLRRIAETTGGAYTDGGATPGALVRLYDDEIAKVARKAFEEAERRERPNRYQWPLALAFGLWIADAGLGDRRRGRR